MTQQTRRWTHPSVLALAPGGDPVQQIRQQARDIVLQNVEKGWAGPPFDPFQLAELLDLQVVPSDDVFDARTVPTGLGAFRIEYNPNRPHGRTRYSIAHEIAHTFFPDCADLVRNRLQHSTSRDDEWELELLCNLGAAEILMPTSVTDLEHQSINLQNLLRLRQEFDVSTEALFLRMIKITNHPCTVFAAASIDDTGPSPYRIDYNLPSRAWGTGLPSHLELGPDTVLSECTAVGYTATGREQWVSALPPFNVECVGIPPFPKHRFPRVVGLLTPDTPMAHNELQIQYFVGSALEPRGNGPNIIAHIVNDRTPTWGGGFALQVRRRWKRVQEDFHEWASAHPSNFSLGQTHKTSIRDDLSIVHMIAQHGYGKSRQPRIRYTALRDCLTQLAENALRDNASVHLPRIGTGEAGGNWSLVRDMIDDLMVRKGVRVVIYDLPTSSPSVHQGILDF